MVRGVPACGIGRAISRPAGEPGGGGGLKWPPHKGGGGRGGVVGEKMEKVGGLGRGRSVGVIGSNVVIQRFNTLV